MTSTLTHPGQKLAQIFWDAANNSSEWYPGKEASLPHASSLLSAEGRCFHALQILTTLCLFDTCCMDDRNLWHVLHRQKQLNPSVLAKMLLSLLTRPKFLAVFLGTSVCISMQTQQSGHLAVQAWFVLTASVYLNVWLPGHVKTHWASIPSGWSTNSFIWPSQYIAQFLTADASWHVCTMRRDMPWRIHMSIIICHSRNMLKLFR